MSAAPSASTARRQAENAAADAPMALSREAKQGSSLVQKSWLIRLDIA